MNTKILLVPLSALLATGAAVTAAAGAQEEAPTDALESAVPLKLEVVFSRYDGETKIGRLPFSLPLSSAEPGRMKMGLMVPLNVRTEGGQGPPTVMFKDVVTGVDCQAARQLSGGRFALRCEFYQDSVYDDRETMPDKAELAPAVRRFASETTLVLRDGETAQYSATDPLTGQVLEVDVTLDVVD